MELAFICMENSVVCSEVWLYSVGIVVIVTWSYCRNPAPAMTELNNDNFVMKCETIEKQWSHKRPF